MKSYSKVAVIGGTGKSGKYLVKELVAQGFSIRMLLRNPDKSPSPHPSIEIIVGQIQDPKAIADLLHGCDAVVSTLGLGIPPSEPTVFSQATQAILQVMNEHGIRRYIVTTGLNVDTPMDSKSERVTLATHWMQTNYPVSTADKQAEYQLLSESAVDWTLVRLPLIEQTDERYPIRTSLEDCPGEKISATDLAVFLIDQLRKEDFVRKAPFIANV